MTERSGTRVKVCGLTRLEDARLAVALGADALGFVFWAGSPRVVEPAAVRRIVDRLPAFVVRVGVFVNATAAQVAQVVETARLDVAQLHGDEPLDAYADVGARLVRAVLLDDEGAVTAARNLPSAVTPLVDSSDRQRRGGTGKLADWDFAAILSASRPTILAGGLTGDNVRQAIERVRPWAVDVSSGVEEVPGVKSAARMRKFFAAVNASTEGE